MPRSKALFRDWLAPYKVPLDDVMIGSVRNGKEVELLVEPGEHRLRLRVFGKYSPELSIALVAGDIASFDCGPASALYQPIFQREGYITLRRAE